MTEKTRVVLINFPNNPTGQVATHDQLAKWVEYARENKALILFDAAYESFIRDEELPRTIYEIEGAREVAIEFRSFSKIAGFTGVRCAYTVIPKGLEGTLADDEVEVSRWAALRIVTPAVIVPEEQVIEAFQGWIVAHSSQSAASASTVSSWVLIGF